jgi:hypothetical protein
VLITKRSLFSQAVGVLLGSLVLAASAAAEFYVVPTDDALIASSRAIVIGTVTEIHSEFAANGDIVTNIDVDLERVLKGGARINKPLRLIEPGGIVGTKIMVVSAAPQYWVGNRALIFLTQTSDGEWRTHGASLGKFDFVTDQRKRALAVRWAVAHEDPSLWRADGKPHDEKLRDAARFLAYIERAARTLEEKPMDVIHPDDPPTESAEADYFVEEATETTMPQAWNPSSNATYPPSAYTQGSFRWDIFDKGQSATFRASGVQPNYDYIGAAQRGLAAWTNDAGSNVNYVYGGTSAAGFVNDDQNTIVFNSATDVPAGALAYAKWYGGAEHTYKGENFISISEGDVVMKQNPGVTQKVFDEAITHELGHTLGFRHSDQGTPSSTQAVMKAVLSGQYGAALGPWDIEAVRAVYETGAGPTLPGTPANLVATATSTTSITITWGAVSGATSYTLERSTNISSGWTVVVPAHTSTSYTDTGRTANTTYVYRVRANTATASGASSNLDHATTILFTDDPLIAGSTRVKAVHLTQLRTAVNAVRVAAGLGQVAWTDPTITNTTRIKAVHINELRNALTPALAALGKTATYTDPALGSGTPIKAVHFQELRNLTK